VFKRKRLEPHSLRIEALTSSHSDISSTRNELPADVILRSSLDAATSRPH
jgi:hypothetical protein